MCANLIINTVDFFQNLSELPLPIPLIANLENLYPVYCKHSNKSEHTLIASITANQALNRASFEMLLFHSSPFGFLRGYVKIRHEYFKTYHSVAPTDELFLCTSCCLKRLNIASRCYTFLFTHEFFEDVATLTYKWHTNHLVKSYFCNHCLRTPLISVIECDAPNDVRKEEEYYRHFSELF